MRSRLKEWRNAPGGKWSARIIWYEKGDGENIRLELTDCEQEKQLFPKSKFEADRIWFMFRQGAPQGGQKIPFINDLLDLISKIPEPEKDQPHA